MMTTLRVHLQSAVAPLTLVLGMLVLLPTQNAAAQESKQNGLRKLLTSLKKTIEPSPEKPSPEKPSPEKPSPEKPSPEKLSPEKLSPEKQFQDKPARTSETGIARIRRRLPDVTRRLKQAVAPELTENSPHTTVVKELERLREQSAIPAIPKIGRRLPGVGHRLQQTFTPQPRRVAPSRTVLKELQRLYRQSGVRMPKMAFPKSEQPSSSPKTIKPAAPRKIKSAAATQPTADQKREIIAQRGARAGLKGFCPVALREEQQLLNTQPEINLTYSGRVYLFSSVSAREKFQSDPKKFLPAANGMDVVLKSRRRPGPGSLDHAVFYKGRLYLFASAESLRTFRADSATYAESQ